MCWVHLSAGVFETSFGVFCFSFQAKKRVKRFACCNFTVLTAATTIIWLWMLLFLYGYTDYHCVSVWSSQARSLSLSVLMGTCREELPRSAVFYAYGTTTVAVGATVEHYEKQYSSTRNSYVPGVNSTTEFGVLKCSTRCGRPLAIWTDCFQSGPCQRGPTARVGSWIDFYLAIINIQLEKTQISVRTPGHWRNRKVVESMPLNS